MTTAQLDDQLSEYETRPISAEEKKYFDAALAALDQHQQACLLLHLRLPACSGDSTLLRLTVLLFSVARPSSVKTQRTCFLWCVDSPTKRNAWRRQ